MYVVSGQRSSDGSSLAGFCPGILAGSQAQATESVVVHGGWGCSSSVQVAAQSSKFPACYGSNIEAASPNVVFACKCCISSSMFL